MRISSCSLSTPNLFMLYFVGAKGPCVFRRSQCERHNCPFLETPKSFMLFFFASFCAGRPVVMGVTVVLMVLPFRP